MRARSRRRTTSAKIVVMMLGLCLISMPRHGDATERRSSTFEGLRPELIAVDSRGAVSFIPGPLGQIDLQNADRGAALLMEEFAPLFRVPVLGQFRSLSTKRDDLGLTHVRMQQFIDGMPVVGADVYVHADEMGTVYAVNGTPAADWSASAPGLTADTAVRLALHELRIDASPTSEPALTYVLDHERRARLAWVFEVEYVDAEGPQRDRVFADATDGSVAARHPRHYFAKNRLTYSLNHGTSLPGVLQRIEGQGPAADASVNRAHDIAGQMYDYYSVKFGRDSFNNGGSSIKSTVHYSSNYANVFWNGTQLVYGDGNGVDLSEPTVLDVGSHEYTHGVTQYESGLIYANEPGAINEAISDIFAANIEAWVDGAISLDTWKIAEDCWTPGTPGDALRYMYDPVLDGFSKDYYPQRYTGASDNGGVHWNCGIANLAYVLLVQGGTHPRGKTTVVVPGIGMIKAEQIFYRAQTTYLTANSGFHATRNATLQAAADLYTPSVVGAVALAWDAVGLQSTATSVGPGEAPAPVARILGVSPNPFNQSTQVRYNLPRAGEVVFHVYDSSGRVIRELIADAALAGEGLVTWDGRDDRAARVSSGTYFMRLAGAPEVDAVRVTFVR